MGLGKVLNVLVVAAVEWGRAGTGHGRDPRARGKTQTKCNAIVLSWYLTGRYWQQDNLGGQRQCGAASNDKLEKPSRSKQLKDYNESVDAATTGTQVAVGDERGREFRVRAKPPSTLGVHHC